MKHPFRETAKEAKRERKARHYRKDCEGRTVIRMTVKNDDGFLSEFSESDTPVISADVAEFLESSVEAIPPKEPLALEIYSDCIDAEERVLYESAVKEYYLQRFLANEHEIKHNRLLMLLLGMLGVLVLAGEILYDYRVGSAIWTEVIDIVAWVLLWEATDIALLGGRDLRIRKKRCLAFLSMKISYFSGNE